MTIPESLGTLLHEATTPNNEPARSLPPQCYTSKEFLQHELHTVFKHEWLCVGREGDIPNVGDYFTIQLLDEPLIIVRSDDNKIRALSNTCRHRNMQVAEGKGNRKLFVCPYHAWSYSNNGALKVAPLMDMKSTSLSKCSLPELNNEVWMGFIFVNLKEHDTLPAPVSLRERLQNLEPLIANYHGESFTTIFDTTENWNCNWKSLVENFMEGYHLSTVHPVSLGNSTPTRLCQKLPGGPYHTAYKAGYPDNAAKREYWHPDTTEDERNCSTLYSVFPGLVVSQSPDVLAWLALTPKAVDRVTVRWGLAAYSDDLSEPQKQAYIEKWHTINNEDKAKLEKVRQGLKSNFASCGPLAPDNFEGTIKDFYQYLTTQLSG